MKMICYKLMSVFQKLLLYLSCLVFASLLFGTHANAENLEINWQSSPSPTNGWSWDATKNWAQSITATSTFILSRVGMPLTSLSASSTMSVCQVSTVSDYTCLDTPATSTNIIGPDNYSNYSANYLNNNLSFYNFSGYTIYDNNIYIFWVTNSNGSIFTGGEGQMALKTPTQYAGGQVISNSGYDWYGIEVYGNDVVTISGTIYWAGVGAQYGQIGGNWNIPFYWNICSSYGEIQDLYAVARTGIYDFGEGVNLIQDKSSFIGPQACSGIAYYTGTVLDPDPTTYDAYFALYTTADGDIATSSDFTVIINDGGTVENYFDSSIISPLHLNYGSGTTTLPFSYNFTGLAYSGGEVCIYNEVASSTSNCVDVTSASGVGFMGFPDPNHAYTLNAHYVLLSSTGANLMSSDSFIINWANTIQGKPACQDLAPDYTNICDGINTGTTVGELQCGFKYGLASAGYWLFQPTCATLTSFSNSYDIFKGSFPFNAYYDLVGTIDEAISTTTVSTNAVFSVPMVSATGTIYMMPSISSSSISNTIGAENNTLFRQTLSWLMWILAAILVGVTIYMI